MRSEEQAISMEPLSVVLGSETYTIKLLGINAQVEWRRQLDLVMNPLMDQMNQVVSGSSFAGALTTVLLQFPEKMTDLVFAYAPDLPKNTVMDEATEEQISRVFSQVMEIAFPFLAPLAMVMQLKRRTPAASLSRQ